MSRKKKRPTLHEVIARMRNRPFCMASIQRYFSPYFKTSRIGDVFLSLKCRATRKRAAFRLLSGELAYVEIISDELPSGYILQIPVSSNRDFMQKIIYRYGLFGNH